MFDLPPRPDLSEQRDEQFNEWLDRIRHSNVTILGSGPAGLTAGIFLQKRGRDVALLDEAEQIGGRVFWQSGPIPILSPTDELLEEIGYPIQSNPPIWLDRVEFVNFLLNEFIRCGGAVVPGVYVGSLPRDDGELSLSLRDYQEVIETDELLLTTPRVSLGDLESTGGNPLESMVLNTTRLDDAGWIIAGFQALPEADREADYPFENAECLSGRKATEIVLTGE